MKTTWIVAYDFSDQARAAFSAAGEMLARQGGGRLIVAHAHPEGSATQGIGLDLVTLAPSAELERAYRRDAESALAEELLSFSAAGVEVEHRVIAGAPADAITNLAIEEHAGLIAVGSHGRRGLERLLLGSVAEAITRRARCPVLVVRAPPLPVSPGSDFTPPNA